MKGFLVASVLSVLCFSAMPGAAGAAVSLPDEVLTYDVYAGGVHAMQANLTLRQDGGGYKAVLDTATIGFLKRMAPWSGVFSTEGWIEAVGQRQPRLHTSAATWKGETETKEYGYDRSGNFVFYKVTESGKDKSPDKMDPSLTPQGVTDVLSATLAVMDRLDQGKSCSSSSLVFDGDRSFKMVFSGKDEAAILPKTDYNIYEGPAVACTVEVKPEAGKWRKKPRGWLSIQEQGRKAGTMPTVWFARQPGVAGGRHVPVRVQVRTDYGTLVMHLTARKEAPEPQ